MELLEHYTNIPPSIIKYFYINVFFYYANTCSQLTIDWCNSSLIVSTRECIYAPHCISGIRLLLNIILSLLYNKNNLFHKYVSHR